MNFNTFFHGLKNQHPQIPANSKSDGSIVLSKHAYQYSNELLEQKTSDVLNFATTLDEPVDNNLNNSSDINANSLYYLQQLNEQFQEIDIKKIQTKLSFGLKFVHELINVQACKYINDKFWCNLSKIMTDEWKQLIKKWCLEYQQVS